ncbi:MAG: penicillin acylase family protein [Thermoleophilaceae bacterium]
MRLALALLALLVLPSGALAAERYDVTIKRGEHGIPHIVAADWDDLGYGYAYAFAQDNVCVIADSYVTVNAERSRFFGPDGSYAFRGNGTNPNNLNSDFFYKRIIEEGTVERLLAQPPPDGPLDEIREAVRGYVAGYNAWLADTGVENITDPRCRGEEWVRPITEIDVYRRFYQLALLASSGVAIDGIGSAAPLLDPGAAAAAQRRQRTELGNLAPGAFDELLGGIGSNAVGLGSAGTQSGKGLLLGNPHFPWDGAERFYQAHLTIPGKVDVSGGALFGVPLVLIGYNRDLAWSHTVSTARRFTPFEVKLAPGSATTYLVDGEPREMSATRVSVMAKREDGGLEERTRTLYATEYGPMITAILGLPIFPWTPASGYSLGDVNANNFRYLNHFFLTNQAHSVSELDGILREYQGIPWVNTIAADSAGKAYYADIGAVPHATDEHVARCSAPLGIATNPLLRVQILDGSRGDCAWGSDPDAAAPGILGPGRMPALLRDDYVSNMNDSYWLTNPEQPLEGYDLVIGDERTARAPRTRLGLRIVQQRLDGSDGLEGRGFTRQQLQDAVFNNRQYLGEQWRDELVGVCRGDGSLGEACDVLAAWDLRDDLDSRGALLFRRFASRALSSPLPVGGPLISPWRDAFSAGDPVNTPSGLNTSSPLVRQALRDAVADLRGAGIPLDAPLRDFQYEQRGDERIPIHGGPGTVGVFNAINVSWDPENGYDNVPHGSSYVQAVEVDGGCPDARTILTYSQSSNPESPWYSDQTRMFSRKEWVDPPFCESELRREPLAVRDLGRGYTRRSSGRLFRSLAVRDARRRGSMSVSVRTRRRSTVTVRVTRAGRRVGSARRRVSSSRRARAIPVHGLARGRYEVEVEAVAGERRHVLTRAVRVR